MKKQKFSILDALSGGNFSKKENNVSTYSLFLQFDNDEPKEIFTNINSNKEFIMSFDNKENNKIIFKDLKTNKTFKLFIK